MQLILLKYFVQWYSCLIPVALGTMLSLTISTSFWNAWNGVDLISGWQFSCLCGQHWLEDHLRGFEGQNLLSFAYFRLILWFNFRVCLAYAHRGAHAVCRRGAKGPLGDHGVSNLKNLGRPFGFWIWLMVPIFVIVAPETGWDLHRWDWQIQRCWPCLLWITSGLDALDSLGDLIAELLVVVTTHAGKWNLVLDVLEGHQHLYFQ